jgi:hypothetical protein
MLSGCATRQVSESLHGSTSQRLVTYSLERFVEELVDQPEFQRVGGNHVQLDIHFLNDHNLLDYASELLRHRLLTKSRILRVSDSGEESAQYRVQVFFNSIATDHDSFGLTLPTFGLAATPNARINVLAVDMFHGVTEGYAVITSTADATAESTQRILVRVRADNVATPIVDFPVNQLER